VRKVGGLTILGATLQHLRDQPKLRHLNNMVVHVPEREELFLGLRGTACSCPVSSTLVTSWLPFQG
jgi:hypothetical protein